MSKDATLRPPGSIPALVQVARDLLSSGAGLPAWALGSQDARTVLVELTQLRAQVDELTARTLAQAVEVGAGEETGATSTANWLAVATQQTRTTAHRQSHLALELAAHPQVRAALAAGRLVAEKAEVITHALDQLPENQPATEAAECRDYLIEAATRFDATALRRLGRCRDHDQDVRRHVGVV